MKSVILLASFLLMFDIVFSQQAGEPLIPIALVTAYDKSNQNLLSARINPAAAMGSKRTSFLLYAENRFLVKELPFIMGAVYIPVSSWGITVDYSRLGNFHINQSAANISISKTVHPFVDIGLTLSASSLNTIVNASQLSFGYKVGMMFRCNKELVSGFSFKRTEFSTGNNSEFPNVEVSAGLGYSFSAVTNAALQISRAMDGDIALAGGISLKIKDKIRIDAGYSSSNYSLFGGVTIHHRFIRLGCYFSGHPYLGISPGLMLMSP